PIKQLTIMTILPSPPAYGEKLEYRIPRLQTASWPQLSRDDHWMRTQPACHLLTMRHLHQPRPHIPPDLLSRHVLVSSHVTQASADDGRSCRSNRLLP